MQIELLYQDQDVAVVLKPAGVVVNRAETVTQPTIQDWWQDQLAAQPPVAARSWQAQVPPEFTGEYGSPEQIFTERGGIVHRLDKETSGALLLAKHPGSLVNLLQQFRLRQTEKKYLCLVHGKFQILADTVSLPIARASQQRTKFQVVPDGRQAETRYQVTQFFRGVNLAAVVAAGQQAAPIRQLKQKIERGYQGFSLVECWPKTGRTHQIRVHFTHLRHPLVADPSYVGHKRLQLDQVWCPRLFLHATSLVWHDPRSGAPQTVTAPLPADLTAALACLESA